MSQQVCHFNVPCEAYRGAQKLDRAHGTDGCNMQRGLVIPACALPHQLWQHVCGRTSLAAMLQRSVPTDATPNVPPARGCQFNYSFLICINTRICCTKRPRAKAIIWPEHYSSRIGVPTWLICNPQTTTTHSTHATPQLRSHTKWTIPVIEF